MQAEKVKRQSKDFEFRVEEFFSGFKRNMPYEYSSDFEKAYETMDRIHHGPRSEENPFGSLLEIKEDSVKLNEMQELFELFVIEYRQVCSERNLASLRPRCQSSRPRSLCYRDCRWISASRKQSFSRLFGT